MCELIYDSPFGPVMLAASRGKLRRVELLPPSRGDQPGRAHDGNSKNANIFLDLLDRYFAGRDIRLPLTRFHLEDITAFDKRVYEVLLGVRFGHTVSYGQLAAMAGCSGGARAVGGALGRNPVPIFVPCHRVLRSDGSLGGFGAGTAWKRSLLMHEGVRLGD